MDSVDKVPTEKRIGARDWLEGTLVLLGPAIEKPEEFRAAMVGFLKVWSVIKKGAKESWVQSRVPKGEAPGAPFLF